MSDSVIDSTLAYLLLYDFEIKLFRNGMGSISVVATKGDAKSVYFVSEDGTRYVDPPPSCAE